MSNWGGEMICEIILDNMLSKFGNRINMIGEKEKKIPIVFSREDIVRCHIQNRTVSQSLPLPSLLLK
jgi:hypothetical protein